MQRLVSFVRAHHLCFHLQFPCSPYVAKEPRLTEHGPSLLLYSLSLSLIHVRLLSTALTNDHYLVSRCANAHFHNRTVITSCARSLYIYATPSGLRAFYHPPSHLGLQLREPECTRGGGRARNRGNYRCQPRELLISSEIRRRR